MDVVHIHAFAQHLDKAEGLNVFGNLFGQRSLQVFALVVIEFFLLGGFEKVPQPFQVEGQFLVEVLGLAPIILVLRWRLGIHIGLTYGHALLMGAAHQGFLYQSLEGLFVGFA